MYLKFCNTRSSVRTTHLIKRGCKHRLFKDAVAKVRQIPCSTALEASIKNESHRIPFVITFNPVSSHFQQPQQSSFFTTVPRSTFFFSSYIVPALQKPTRRTGQGQTLQAIEKTIAKQHIDQPTVVSDHFSLPAHSMDNIELVPLELITKKRDMLFARQKKRS